MLLKEEKVVLQITDHSPLLERVRTRTKQEFKEEAMEEESTLKEC